MNTILSAAPPSSAAAKIIQLRELLAEKYPEAPVRPDLCWPTGIGALDQALDGGLCKGGMVEMVGERPSAGVSSFMRAMLTQASGHGLWAALIDGRDCFDPQAVEASALRRLLWVRCQTAAEAMQSADLLLRDGNLPLVFLDLRSNPAAELRQVASQSWYRLQRMLEPTATALLALTPFPLIPCADARLRLQASFPLAALEEEAPAALERVRLEVMRKRRQRSGGTGGEEILWAEAG